MGKKDENYYKIKLKEIKDFKRQYCSGISPDDYDTFDLDGNRLNNKQIKKIKQELKTKQRALKRSEKQQIDKHIDDELDNYYNKDDE